MATAEANICNVALSRAGQGQFITSLDPNVDPSAQAVILAVAYPAARDALLCRAPWTFATREQVLATAALGPTDPKVLPGYAHVYVDPSDILEAQYIFDGIRPGAAALAVINQATVSDPPLVSSMPAIAGRARAAPFKRSAGYVFTDWADSPITWSSTTTYSLNSVVTNADGTWSRSIQAANLNHLTSDGAWWTVVTDPASAILVYTASVTDATLFPPLFQDALRWQLAAELALNKTKYQVAKGLQEKAEEAIQLAMAAELNAQEPEFRPDSAFIAVRS